VRRVTRLAFAALVLASAALAAGCRITVRPPSDVVDPVTVFVVDQGRHSALVLPTSAGGAELWTFGEWRWFALDQTAWWRTPAVVLWPTRATLGRAPVHVPLVASSIARAFGAESVHEVVVERAAALALEAELERRFAAGSDERLHSTLYRLDFAPDEARSYWIGHHCNSEAKAWLRALGCDVRGSALVADFAVVVEDAAAPRAP